MVAGRCGLRRNERIRRSADFTKTIRGGRRTAGKFLFVRFAPNGLDVSRLGLSVGRRFGNSVRRNKWKRMVREAFRLSKSELPKGMDLVVSPSRNAGKVLPDLPQFRKELIRLLPGESGTSSAKRSSSR